MLTSAQGRARRAKGKAGEREFRTLVIQQGIDAERVSECEGDLLICLEGWTPKVEVRRTEVTLPEAHRVMARADFLAQRLDRRPWKIWTNLRSLLILVAHPAHRADLIESKRGTASEALLVFPDIQDWISLLLR